MSQQFRYGAGGSLVCDEEIEGVTQRLNTESSTRFYGGRFFIGESMKVGAARKIAELLGGTLVEHAADFNPSGREVSV